MGELKEYYTVEDVARLLSVTPYTVRTWLKDEKLNGFKMNAKSWRIPKESLQEFLRKRHG